MSTFSTYLKLGIYHILDRQAYDHVLFVVALAALYVFKEWRHVLILVTAFTLGHSITLILAARKIISIDSELVETLIPITILITAISNIMKNQSSTRKRSVQINYLYALFFGLIHGLGFSNYFRSLLGSDNSIVLELFAFNVGIEIGQILIVTTVLLTSFVFVSLLSVSRRDWNMTVSAAVGGIALTLIL